MKASQAVLKSLVEAKASALCPHITTHLNNSLDLLPHITITADQWLQHPYPFLDKIDISWLESQQLRLHELGKSPIPQIAQFSHFSLWQSLVQNQTKILPFQVAKQQTLGNLLELSKSESVRLFHLLGLFDLSLDLKKTVQTPTLQAIKSALSTTQIQFLKSLSNKTTTVDFGRLDLDRWDKQPQSLQDVLFNRGLNRLAKALFHAESSIIWYFERILDKAMGTKFKKLISDLKNTPAQKTLVTEVQTALDHVRKLA
ncbi:MAG: hypothetical protein H7A39_04245 [Chlamydiales bacterium]|nr:hypothetical protein [Chlamydiales bacterium]